MAAIQVKNGFSFNIANVDLNGLYQGLAYVASSSAFYTIVWRRVCRYVSWARLHLRFVRRALRWRRDVLSAGDQRLCGGGGHEGCDFGSGALQPSRTRLRTRTTSLSSARRCPERFDPPATLALTLSPATAATTFSRALAGMTASTAASATIAWTAAAGATSSPGVPAGTISCFHEGVGLDRLTNATRSGTSSVASTRSTFPGWTRIRTERPAIRLSSSSVRMRSAHNYGELRFA